MPDPYTYLGKPTGANYTFANSEGKIMYDQSDLTYDSSTTYWDGYNPTTTGVGGGYTLVAKPTGANYTYISKPST